jgi:hypothetical protein
MNPTQAALRRGTKRAVDAPERPRSDLGPSGLAQKARASTVVETAEAGMRVRWMDEDTPLSHLRRGALLTDRQCDAVGRLAEYYEASGRRSSVCGSYGQRAGGFGQMTDEQAECWKRYCKLLDEAPPATRHALAMVAAGEFPGFTGALPLLRAGATALADHLRFNY